MSEVETPSLIVDDREKDRAFLSALGGHFQLTRKHLPSGDYAWSCPLGLVGVERKSMADLTQSQNNKRLDDELRRLVEMYSIPVLFITGEHASRWSHRDDETIENIKLGRQLHGVYVYHVVGEPARAAAGMHRLWRYTRERLHGATDGVRRERRLSFWGPLGPRAEVIYGILGMTPGIRNRRGVAAHIAETVPLSEFLTWSVSDFQFAGFSTLMAKKLATVLATLEEPTLSTNISS